MMNMSIHGSLCHDLFLLYLFAYCSRLIILWFNVLVFLVGITTGFFILLCIILDRGETVQLKFKEDKIPSC